LGFKKNPGFLNPALMLYPRCPL